MPKKPQALVREERKWAKFLEKYVKTNTDIPWNPRMANKRERFDRLPPSVLNKAKKQYRSGRDVDDIGHYAKTMSFEQFKKFFLDELYPEYRYRYRESEQKGFHYLPDDLRYFMKKLYNHEKKCPKGSKRRPFDMRCVKPCPEGEGRDFKSKKCKKVECDDGYVYSYVKGKCYKLYSSKEDRILFGLLTFLLQSWRDIFPWSIATKNNLLYGQMDQDELVFLDAITNMSDEDFSYYGKIEGRRMSHEILKKNYNIIMKAFLTNYTIGPIQQLLQDAHEKIYKLYMDKYADEENDELLQLIIIQHTKAKQIAADQKKSVKLDNPLYVSPKLIKKAKSEWKNVYTNEFVEKKEAELPPLPMHIPLPKDATEAQRKRARIQIELYQMDGLADYYNRQFYPEMNKEQRKKWNMVHDSDYYGKPFYYVKNMTPYQRRKLMIGHWRHPTIKVLKEEHKRSKHGIKQLEVMLMDWFDVDEDDLKDDAENYYELYEQEYRQYCEDGKEINPKTGHCRKKCTKDQYRDDKTGKCKKRKKPIVKRPKPLPIISKKEKKKQKKILEHTVLKAAITDLPKKELQRAKEILPSYFIDPEAEEIDEEDEEDEEDRTKKRKAITYTREDLTEEEIKKLEKGEILPYYDPDEAEEIIKGIDKEVVTTSRRATIPPVGSVKKEKFSLLSPKIPNLQEKKKEMKKELSKPKLSKKKKRDAEIELALLDWYDMQQGNKPKYETKKTVKPEEYDFDIPSDIHQQIDAEKKKKKKAEKMAKKQPEVKILPNLAARTKGEPQRCTRQADFNDVDSLRRLTWPCYMGKKPNTQLFRNYDTMIRYLQVKKNQIKDIEANKAKYDRYMKYIRNLREARIPIKIKIKPKKQKKGFGVFKTKESKGELPTNLKYNLAVKERLDRIKKEVKKKGAKKDWVESYKPWEG